MNAHLSFLQTIQHYWTRLTASDPGLMRFKSALKILLSVISAVLTTSVIIGFFNIGPGGITVPIFSGVVGLVSTFVVFDDTKAKKQMTTFLMAITSMLAISLGSYLYGMYYLSDIAIVLVVFLAFYLSRFSSRYFSLSVIAFFSIYFSTILKVELEMIPWYYLAIAIGGSYAFVYNFVVLKDQPEKVLQRSMHSFHIQTNLIMNLVKQMIVSPTITPRQIKTLDQNLTKVNEYARHISGQLATTSPSLIWKGIRANELRLYVYDVDMLMQSLSPAVERLRAMQHYQQSPFQDALLDLVESIRSIRVLRNGSVPEQLTRAEKALQALRHQIREVSDQDSEEWLYLVRRMETIANHVIDGVTELHRERKEHLTEEQPAEDEEQEDQATLTGLHPTTKKAIQALVAGAISVYLGYTLTPAHPYWILLSSFIIFMGTESVGSTFMKANQRTLGTVLGALAGFGLAQLISNSTIEVSFIFLCIFMAFYLFPVSYSIMIFWITMVVAMLYDLLLGGITPMVMGVRVIDTFIGAYVGLFAASFILPTTTRDKIADYASEFFHELSDYVHSYLNHLLHKRHHENFAEKSFELDQKLELIRVESLMFRYRPGRFGRSGIERWHTVLSAINYYAKQLHATRHSYPKIEKDMEETLEHVQYYVLHNINNIHKLIKGTGNITVYELEEDRRAVERFTIAEASISDRLFVYKLYYIWRINQSLVTLASDMGATVELAPSKHHQSTAKPGIS
ncbi:FUSC family protein [Pontibacillus salicampi]|uniref:FUSC family protein n=1 Tax=Pontibacillus salicampi TaxID=1449801 RepID=A0ABV6LQ64_9BACI